MHANQWNNRYQIGQPVLVRETGQSGWIRAVTATPAREVTVTGRCFIDVKNRARRFTVPLDPEWIRPETDPVLRKFGHVIRGPRPASEREERRYDDGAVEYSFLPAEASGPGFPPAPENVDRYRVKVVHLGEAYWLGGKPSDPRLLSVDRAGEAWLYDYREAAEQAARFVRLFYTVDEASPYYVDTISRKQPEAAQ